MGKPSRDMLTYLCDTRPWVTKIVAIQHNANLFVHHFILNRAIMLKWKPEVIRNVLKIISMKMVYLLFMDSVSFHSCTLRKLPEAFGLEDNKSWYTTNLTRQKTSVTQALCPT